MRLSAAVSAEGTIRVAYSVPAVTGFNDASWPLDGYFIRISVGNDSYLNLTLSGDTLQRDVSGLTRGVTYTFFVSGFNWAGEGFASSTMQTAMYRASPPLPLSTDTSRFSEQLQVSHPRARTSRF